MANGGVGSWPLLSRSRRCRFLVSRSHGGVGGRTFHDSPSMGSGVLSSVGGKYVPSYPIAPVDDTHATLSMPNSKGYFLKSKRTAAHDPRRAYPQADVGKRRVSRGCLCILMGKRLKGGGLRYVRQRTDRLA
jgi:hypothetical protein